MTEQEVELIAERVAIRVMARWPRVYIDQLVGDILREVPGVVRIRYDLKKDHDGEDAVFFRILVADEVCPKDEVRDEIVEAVQRRMFAAFEACNLFPYVGWRSVSDQARRKSKEWE